MALEQGVEQQQESEAPEEGKGWSGEEAEAQIFVKPKALDGEDAAAREADSKSVAAYTV